MRSFIIYLNFVSLLAVCLFACNHHSSNPMLQQVDSLLEMKPDSALTILKNNNSPLGTEHRLPMGGDFFLHIGYEFSGYGNESCITGTGQSIPVTPLLPDLCRFGT